MRIVIRLACHATAVLGWPSVVALRLLLHPRFGMSLSFGGCGAQLAAEAVLAVARRRSGASAAARLAVLEERMSDLGDLNGRVSWMSDLFVGVFRAAGATVPAPHRAHLRIVPPNGSTTGPQRKI
jgi:hypothetical protein